MRSPILLTALLCVVTCPARAEPPATQPSRIEVAITHLTDKDYAARQAAVQELQAAIARQIQSFALLPDPEARVRAGAALAFQEGLSAWAIELAKLPEVQRRSLLVWGLQPAVAPALATIYAGSGNKTQAIRALGKLSGDQATDALAMIAAAHDSQTAIPALDALWDRKPTPTALNLLWGCLAAQLGTEAQPAEEDQNAGNPAPKPESHFSREPDDTSEYDISVEAAQTLVHWKHPETLTRFKTHLAQMMGNGKDNNSNSELVNRSSRRDVFLTLVLGFKTREALPLIAQAALGERSSSSSGNLGDKGPVYQSNRTGMLGVFAELTGQDPADYKLFRCKEWGESDLCNWVVHTEEQEKEAVEKAKKWWQTNQAKMAPAAREPAAP